SVVARPKLAIVARKDRADLLAKRPGCAPLGWACLGRAAAVPGGWRALGGPPVWGPVKLGLQSAETATGLALFGQAVAEYFGHRPGLTAAARVPGRAPGSAGPPVTRRAVAVAMVAAALTIAGCVSTKSKTTSGGGALPDVPKGCTAVDLATSPEKYDLLTDMA